MDRMQSRAWQPDSSFVTPRWREMDSNFYYRAAWSDEFVRRGAMSGGLVWHFPRPPVQSLDFEVDVRGVAHELVI